MVCLVRCSAFCPPFRSCHSCPGFPSSLPSFTSLSYILFFILCIIVKLFMCSFPGLVCFPLAFVTFLHFYRSLVPRAFPFDVGRGYFATWLVRYSVLSPPFRSFCCSGFTFSFRSFISLSYILLFVVLLRSELCYLISYSCFLRFPYCVVSFVLDCFRRVFDPRTMKSMVVCST